MNLIPAKPKLHLATPQDAERLNARLVEAARYALLRRLAPAMRHEIAGALQPLRMVSTVLDKRLQMPEPDIAALVKNSSAIGQLVREASSVCTGFMSWLTPKEEDRLSMLDGVNQSVKLLGTDLMLRGFTVEVASDSGVAELPAGPLRQVFSICALALTDLTPGPACVCISFQESAKELVIMIRIESADGDGPCALASGYRSMDWDDVQLLAGAEGVGLKRLSNGADLIFPR